MKPTDGASAASFSPTRLTVARRMRGYTKKALADMIGLTAPAITQYESDLNPPSDDTLHHIARVLDLPFEFFVGPDLNVIDDEALTFRSRRSMTAILRGKAASLAMIAESLIAPAIRNRFRLPQSDLPDLAEHVPEEAASLLRCQWQLGYGPITNMVHLLESRGIEVFWLNENASSLDAFSWWENDRPFVMLNSAKPAGDRGRFDAAHELAHLVLHRREKDLDSRKVETEADSFASALLLPAEQFRQECPRQPIMQQFRPLKKRWGVSLAAMVRRCRDVGVFSDWQYECACRDIAKNGWKMNEPWPVAREQSQFHQAVFERLLQRDITPERFAEDLGLPLSQLQILVPVVAKMLDGEEDKYSLVKLREMDELSRA